MLALLDAGQVFRAWRQVSSEGKDFQSDYIPAQRLLAGADIYAPIRLDEVVALGIQEEDAVGMRANVHPPLTALLIAPLALLSFSTATLIWTVGCTVLLMAMGLVLMVELDLPLHGLWRPIVLLVLPNWYPVWHHLHVGQLTILLFGLIVGAWYCRRRGYEVLSGSLLGIATLLKIYPAVFLVHALVRGGWRVLAGASVAILALVLVQAAVNPDHWMAYIMHVAPTNAAQWMPDASNISLAGISMHLFTGSAEVRAVFLSPRLELPARVALYGAVLGSLVAVLWRRRRSSDVTAEYCLCLSAMPLLSPLTWDHACIFLLLPFAYAWMRTRAQPGRQRSVQVWLMVAALLLSFFPDQIVFASLKRAYGFQQMPPIAHRHATGLVVLIFAFAAMVAMTWNPESPSSSVLS
jgi:Glycosyltransferase family 87